MSPRFFLRILLTVASLAPAPALADAWKLIKLQGDAVVFRSNHWSPLKLGDIVDDSSPIKTLTGGSALFARDGERIDMGSDTHIEINDRNGQRFTTVHEFRGTVGIEANVENVRHFEVVTPFLAAIVKGTVFGVSANASGASVSVLRGRVAVQRGAQTSEVYVEAGQSADVKTGGSLSVFASGGNMATPLGGLAAAFAPEPAEAAVAQLGDRVPDTSGQPRGDRQEQNAPMLAVTSKSTSGPATTSGAPTGGGPTPPIAVGPTPKKGGGKSQRPNQHARLARLPPVRGEAT